MHFKRIPSTNFLNDIHHNFLDGVKQLALVEFGRNVDVRISIRPGPE